MEARGFILAAPVALALGAGFVPVRKAGKLPRATYAVSYALEYGEATLEMHRDALAPGDRVLLVDDVLATGGTVAATRRLVERCGAVAHGVAVLMELGFLPGRRGHRRPAPDQPDDRLSAAAAPVDSVHGDRRQHPGGARARGSACADEPADAHRATGQSSRVPSPRGDARPAGPDGRRPQPGREPRARAAVPRDPGQPPQGRPGPDRARLPDRRAAARHPDAQERRPLHHPPARGHHDPGRHRHDRADAGRRAAARHGRGHAVHPRPAARRLRRRGRPARRRRHQARQGQVRRLRAGRDHPQDDRRDVARHPGAGHQARRPAAQHAHPALRQAVDPGAAGDARRSTSTPRWPTGSA